MGQGQTVQKNSAELIFSGIYSDDIAKETSNNIRKKSSLFILHGMLFCSSSLYCNMVDLFSAHLTNYDRLICREAVLRNLKIQWRRSFPYTAGDIVVRTVARTEPTTEIASLANRHTSKMSTDAKHDQPFRVLNTIAVGLWISQTLPLCILSLLDFIASPVSDKYGFASPLNDDLEIQMIRRLFLPEKMTISNVHSCPLESH